MVMGMHNAISGTKPTETYRNSFSIDSEWARKWMATGEAYREVQEAELRKENGNGGLIKIFDATQELRF